MTPEVRDRLVLPILIPVGLLVVIAVLTVGFGMLLLFNPLAVSLTVATVVALGVLAAVALATSQPERELTRAKRALIVFAGLTPIILGVLVATDALPTTTEKVVQRKCAFCIPEDAVRLVSHNIAFDQETIQLPAGGDVSILFVNEDAGIPHNVALYPQDPAGQPVVGQPIFQGDIFNGVDQRVLTFGAPPAGTYLFRCDVHPQMLGEAVVSEQGGRLDVKP